MKPPVWVSTAWLPLRHSPYPAVLSVAALLPAVTWGMLDGASALSILRWTAVTIGVALACAIDDPTGDVADGAPMARWQRLGARVLLGSVGAVIVGVGAGFAVHVRQPWLPVASIAVEGIALGAAGVALAVVLRVGQDIHQPAHLAALGMLALMALLSAIPRYYGVLEEQTWGPPWEASRIRWVGVSLVAVGFAWWGLVESRNRTAPPA